MPRRVRDFQKVDPHLRSHPAFLDLCCHLGSEPIVAHGLLSGLWAFAFKFCQNGDVGRFTGRQIAAAVGWAGEPDVMMTALRDSGFLTGDVIHDWAEWGGALFTEREYESRMRWDRRHREKERNRDEQEDVSGDVRGQKRTVRPEESRVEETREEQTLTLLSESTTVVVVDPPDLYPFECFWTPYLKHEKRKACEAKWERLTPEKRRLAVGISTLMRQLHEQGLGPEVEFVPGPLPYLNGELWDDWRDEVPVRWRPRGQNGKAQQAEAAREAFLLRFAAEHGLDLKGE
jgi:hypothetical protein